MGTHATSRRLFQKAAEILPGGVNSPVRAFRSVGGDPVFFERGEGAFLFDVDGNRYRDLVGSWGPLITGHADPVIVEAVCTAARAGLTFGACHAAEALFAEEIRDAVPSMEMLRLVSSGTEAVMSALRVARGATGRSQIVKFDGCYHGHSDPLLSKAGSGIATLGLPDSAGVPPALASATATVPYNDLDAVSAHMDRHGAETAAIVVEPVAGNMGCVPPAPGFLEGLRALCDRYGALLVFDEVMTGFRLSYGGAQQRYGVRPDLTTLGKIVGGGLPLAAYGGRREIMEHVAPLGSVYQAGTLSGNPVAVAAGRAMLRRLREDPPYDRLESKTSRLAEGWTAAARSAGIPVVVNHVGSMVTLFFTGELVTDYASAKRADTRRFAAFFRGMLERGVYLPPSAFEAAFASDALGEDDIDAIVELGADTIAHLEA
ncbi:MAG: glutamate-1-semialdehyde 2,1-aminomutase [Armatimonadota bacterium]